MKRDRSLGDELVEAHVKVRRERKQTRMQRAKVLLPRYRPGDDKDDLVRAVAFIENRLREHKDAGLWRFNLIKVKDDDDDDYPVGFPGWSSQYQELPKKTQCLLAYRYSKRVLKHFLKLYPEWKASECFHSGIAEKGPRVHLCKPTIGEEEDEEDDEWDTSVTFRWY